MAWPESSVCESLEVCTAQIRTVVHGPVLKVFMTWNNSSMFSQFWRLEGRNEMVAELVVQRRPRCLCHGFSWLLTVLGVFGH